MRRAVLLVDHGSRQAEANQVIRQVAEKLRSSCDDPVYTAHMELAEPTVEQALGEAVADGAGCVFVFPYFLGPGRHCTEDIPRLVAEAAARHGGVRWSIGEPFGADARIVELIRDRIRDDSPDSAR